MLQNVARVVTYTRVSTARQGRSGLGLAAQAKAVSDYVAFHNAKIVGAFEEVESGRAKDRPELKAAIAKAKATRSVLLVAKLDRVGRRAAEVLTLLDRRDIKIVFADSPDASPLENGIRAIVAEEEARAISNRTKLALAACKARGVKLGSPKGAAPLLAYQAKHGNVAGVEGARRSADDFAEEMKPYIESYVALGLPNYKIAERLNADGIMPRREGACWHANSVTRLRTRLAI